MSKRKTVLLTGGTGFTGLYVQAALKNAQFDVVCMTSRKTSNLSEYHSNLMDPSSLDNMMQQIKPDYVIHLAAIAFVGHSDNSEFYQSNLFGTLNLLESIKKYCPKVQKVILSSSANIYGNPDVIPVPENSTPKPINHYSMSKMAMETLAINQYADFLPIVITRPFNYTGIGQSDKFLIPKIVSHFKNNASQIELGNLQVVREFNDVRDVANCYLALLNSNMCNDVVNICSGNGLSLLEIIDMCKVITGHSLNVKVNPAFVRANELKVLTGDPRKLISVTNVNFRPFAETLNWMLNA